MPLVTMEPILKDACKRGYAVGSFNVLNLETIRGAILAAEELNSPIIIQLAEVHLPAAAMEDLAPMMVDAAKRAKVPVVVHFDHGKSYESIAKAIRYGFTSVMFDGADHPFEENIRLTKEIVKLANNMGATMEAELGQVGGAEDGSTKVEASLTKVEEAIHFVNETKVDALAVSIGNLHGQYSAPPNLRYDRLQEIHEAVDVPLVLHGGSGTSVEGFKKSIQLGIRKVNIFTALQNGAVEYVKRLYTGEGNQVSYISTMEAMTLGVKEAVKEHICIFGSDQKA